MCASTIVHFEVKNMSVLGDYYRCSSFVKNALYLQAFQTSRARAKVIRQLFFL